LPLPRIISWGFHLKGFLFFFIQKEYFLALFTSRNLDAFFVFFFFSPSLLGSGVEVFFFGETSALFEVPPFFLTFG